MQWHELQGRRSVTAVAHDGSTAWVRWGSGRITGFVGVPAIEVANLAGYPGNPAQYIATHWRRSHAEVPWPCDPGR